MRTRFYWLLIIGLLALPVYSQDEIYVTARYESQETSPLIGEHIDVQLIVEAPVGYEVIFPEFTGRDWDAFGIISIEPLVTEPASDPALTVYRLPLRMAIFRPGEVITPVTVIEVSGEGGQTRVAAEPVVFEIPSMLDESLVLRLSRKVIDLFYIPRTLIFILLSAFIGAIVISTMVLRKRIVVLAGALNKRVQLSQTAAQKALQLLVQVQKDGTSLVLQYAAMSSTLRGYVMERFAISAVDLTTEEMINELQGYLSDARRRELLYLLEQADLVKFAPQESLLTEGQPPLLELAERWIKAVEQQQEIVG